MECFFLSEIGRSLTRSDRIRLEFMLHTLSRFAACDSSVCAGSLKNFGQALNQLRH
jgi:hypothetical protein